MTLVEVYSKNDCSLCERAKSRLRDLQRKLPFDMKEIVLHEGDARFAEYSEKIPVIVVDNDVTYYYKVPEEEFIRELKKRSRGAAL